VQKIHETEYVDYVTARLPWLRRVAYVLCQDWHTADDVTQQTITRVYEQWGRVRAADNMDGYVHTLLVRVFLTERRSRWHRVRLGPDPTEFHQREAPTRPTTRPHSISAERSRTCPPGSAPPWSSGSTATYRSRTPPRPSA
jgi:DNA-directed RNA polymerase specialized sigma24 family protein